MPKLLPTVTTHVSPQEMFTTLGSEWVFRLVERPEQEQLLILLSHWAFETGRGQLMRCNNLGNSKKIDGDPYDWCFYDAGEILTTHDIKMYGYDPAKDPRVVFKPAYMEGGVETREVLFSADHPQCRFHAFPTLADGVAMYFEKKHTKYADADPEKNAWGAVLAGDVVAFCHALKKKRYYTAAESLYTKRVQKVHADMVAMNLSMDGIPYPFEEAPIDLDCGSGSGRDAPPTGEPNK